MDYILNSLDSLVHQSAFFNLTYGNFIMILVAAVFLYLAIKKGYEPLLLVPISFGMLLVNLYPDIMKTIEEAAADGSTSAGLLHYFYLGDEWGIWPSLIFLGVGAMTDFGPLIANPKSFLLGAAAQFGVFFAYIVAILMGFTNEQAAAISIIGGADGPTSIYLAGKLGQTDLMGPIAVAAYSYMSLVPIIQPPIMRLLTTKKERAIKMEVLQIIQGTLRRLRSASVGAGQTSTGRFAPLRWLPPATLLWTCHLGTPCLASCSQPTSFIKYAIFSIANEV